MLLLSLGLPTVSLESAERPNYFLCVTPSRVVRLERWRPDEDFRRQATFIHHQGLWLPGRSSFELHSQKGVFITLTHTQARAQSYDNSYSFKASSSFTIEGKKSSHTHINPHLHLNHLWPFASIHCLLIIEVSLNLAIYLKLI